MKPDEKDKPQGCTGDCTSCPHLSQDGEHGGHSHAMPVKQFRGGLEGWKLALAAFGCFIVPLMLAWLGSYLGGKDQAYASLGALVGLVLGITIAGVTAKIALRKPKEDREDKPNQDGECNL